MTHIMLDLETLSTAYNARILSIGAVKFDEGGVESRFYQPVIVPDEGVIDGFHISHDTLSWWAKQDEEARKVFTDPNAIEIEQALEVFSTWVLWVADNKVDEVRMWGNGAGFDNVILSTAYSICDMEQPWKFYNDRCYRTVKAMNPTAKLRRVGEHHNALDDAESQALHLLDMGVPLGK